jgi:hypothetical protein
MTPVQKRYRDGARSAEGRRTGTLQTGPEWAGKETRGAKVGMVT